VLLFIQKWIVVAARAIKEAQKRMDDRPFQQDFHGDANPNSRIAVPKLESETPSSSQSNSYRSY